MKILYFIIFALLITATIYVSYSYLNYAQMTIVRLDRAYSTNLVSFTDITNNIATIPKLKDGIKDADRKYDIKLEECSKNETEGYCNGLPILATSITTITAGEFQTIDKSLQLKLSVTNGVDIWGSFSKYRHEGCFPPAHGFKLESTKNDNYCYYSITLVRK